MPSRRESAAIATLCAAVCLLPGCSLSTPQAKESKFMKAGQVHRQQRDYARALLDFKNAAQIMPRNPEAHYQIGLTLLEMGSVQSAVYEFQKTIDLDGRHIPAQLRLAEILTRNRNLDLVREAQKRAEAILTLSPGNAEALNALAMAEFRLEDPGDAVRHLQEALQNAPKNLNAAMTLAVFKLQNNDISGAQKVMENNAKEAPGSVEHAFALGLFYTVIHKPGDAERQLRKVLEIDPKYGPAIQALGSVLVHEGKSSEAEQIFRRASMLPDKRYRPLHAIFQLQNGKREAALAEFEQQYKADRQDREARTRLISTYLQLGRTADAEKVLDAALERNPHDAEALIQRAELRYSARKYSEAERDVLESLKFRQDSPEAHLMLARIHQARGNRASQRQELSAALRLDPNLLKARTELARVLTASEMPKLAIELLAEAPENQKRELDFIVERNTALYKLRDFAAMRKGIDTGLAISRTPELLLQDGLLRLTQKDYTGGRASLEELLQRNPQEWRALEALAGSYVAQNNIVQANAVIRQYASRSPSSVPAQNFLGAWLSRTGDRTGARVAFDAAKSLDPKSTVADVELAELDLAEDKLDSARGRLNAVLGREPRNTGALLDLAGVEVKAGNLAEASEYYERVIQEDSSNLPALNNLAFILADTGQDPDRALQLAQRMKELSPNDPATDDTMGWAYYSKGLYDSSVEYLKRAAASGSPGRKCHLAMAYIRIGKRDQALNILQEVMKQNSSLPEVRRALDLLGQAH